MNRRDQEGWPVDERGQRTDPIGRYLESLTPEQQRAWGSTCSADVPYIILKDGRFVTVYPHAEGGTA